MSNPYEAPGAPAESAPTNAGRSNSLRTDKVSGTITCAFGIVMICFASFGLMIVAGQRMMLSAIGPMTEFPEGPSPIDAMNALHGVWFIYLPIMLVGGIVYAVSGFHVRRGSLVARRVAQANAIVGYLWVVAYSISGYQVSSSLAPQLSVLPEPVSTALLSFSMIFCMAIGAAFPTGLFYILSRPQNQAARMQS